eukprot:2305362-Pleurochrysis_carterae.AAC.5
MGLQAGPRAGWRARAEPLPLLETEEATLEGARDKTCGPAGHPICSTENGAWSCECSVRLAAAAAASAAAVAARSGNSGAISVRSCECCRCCASPSPRSMAVSAESAPD